MNSVAVAATSREQGQDKACPGCGHRRGERNQGRCLKCGLDFAAHGATGEDISLYAISLAEDNPRWWTMCRWVISASAGRIQHLALMRSSPASRRFAARNLLLFALGVGLVFGASRGWHSIRRPLDESGTITTDPVGRGWLHVASGRTASGGMGLGVQVWWNPAQSIVAGVAGFIGGLIGGWIAVLAVRGIVELAHRAKYRGEQRMSAALGYATAWLVAALPALVILGFWPLSMVGSTGRLTWTPSLTMLLVLAGAVAGLAAVLGWFWTIRLGASAPADTRARVLAAFLVVIPAMLLAVSIGSWIGVNRALNFLFARMNLSFS